MDFKKLYEQVRNPFRYTFLCYGLNGQAFLNWIHNNKKKINGHLLFPGDVVDGTPRSPVTFDVQNDWHTHAIIFDLDNSDAAVSAIKQLIMGEAEVMKGEG